MKRGATVALVIYTVIVLTVGVYVSALAAGIVGVFGLILLTVWSCLVVASEADDAMEEWRRQ